MGVARTILEWLAIGIGHRQARDCHRLASQGTSTVLQVESRHPEGRPSVSREVIDLIHRTSLANPGWGAPRIHGELLKLGFELSQATVAKYLLRHRKPPSQNWRTFLKNHMQSLVSADFFVVPTITFRLLFVFVILSHDRRRPIHLAVTANPTAEWTTRQLLEAFPWTVRPAICFAIATGATERNSTKRTGWLGIREVLTAPQSLGKIPMSSA